MNTSRIPARLAVLASVATALILTGCGSTGATPAASVVAPKASPMGGSPQPRASTRAHTKQWFVEANDANGDGVLTKAEFDEIRAISHAEKDINHDGVVTDAEYVAEWEGRLEKRQAEEREASIKQAYVRYGVLDLDKNADMTIEEFSVSGNRTFSHYDTNGDGVIDERDGTPKDRFGDLATDAPKTNN